VNKPDAVWDLKTGLSWMSVGQARSYASNLPPGTPFQVIKPSQDE
jgi:hypothetical protein